MVCAEILSPRQFIGRWKDALAEEARAEGKHVARKVGYYKPEDLPGNVWALPDLIVTTKLKWFEDQDEYRLAYTVTDAFAFQNCTYQLVDRKARPSPKPEEHLRQTLELGSLQGSRHGNRTNCTGGTQVIRHRSSDEGEYELLPTLISVARTTLTTIRFRKAGAHAVPVTCSWWNCCDRGRRLSGVNRQV